MPKDRVWTNFDYEAIEKLADILNEILVIRAMGLEIEGLQLMQSQQKSTVK